MAFISSLLYYLINMIGLYGAFALHELGIW